jgi:hypothetical protein
MSILYYTEEEDNSKEESIDKHKDLFLEYEKKLPTLPEALEQMFISAGATEELSDVLTKDIMSKCKKTIEKNLEKIKKKYTKITKEDAYIICSYTCESKDKKFNPYRLLNTSLISENRENGLNNISKYLYIFLNSLRKLEKYIPPEDNKYLYRCITNKVGLSDDPFNKKYVPYKVGNIKTFWGFTSTSPNIKTTYNFLKKEVKIRSGTIFVLGGDIWGYDITLFNYFGEEEILLEPERKYVIDLVLPPINEIININCKMLKTPLPLDTNNLGNNSYDNIQEKKNNENNSIQNNENRTIINDFKTHCICKIQMEINVDEEYKLISGFGFVCNITLKNMKALITYNHIINLNILNNAEKLTYVNNDNEDKEINMKKNRYKYTNEELDITVIQIFDEEDSSNNFIEIDKFIHLRDFEDEEICLVEVEYNKKKKQ